jgi:alpha-galactosidase
MGVHRHKAAGVTKIVLIGAGSAVFTRGLVADLIQAPEFGPWHLGLVDIDAAALETAEGLSRRMIQAQGADITIQADTDRCKVLPGADVVVTTIGVGGRRAWEADVFIPRQYGIAQPVGDTVMPGGISRAMRMVPAMVAIARDVQALCPNAWFFNYSNPMTANCWAIRKATGMPVVGLCHGVFHVERQLAALIDAPPEEVTSLFVGLNHMTFIFDLRLHGHDAWPLVRKRLAEGHGANNPFSWSLFKTYGAYPAVNDRHVTEFFPERFPHGKYYDRGTLGVDVFSFEDTIAHGDRAYAAMRAQALGEQPLDDHIFDRAEGEHEQLLDILRAIGGDTREVFSVNMPNRGIVPNLPPQAILELPAAATARGLRPLQITDFPDPLAAIVTRKAMATQLTVEAALRCDRALFVAALLADGAVTDPDVAHELGEALLDAQREHLPEDWFTP